MTQQLCLIKKITLPKAFVVLRGHFEDRIFQLMSNYFSPIYYLHCIFRIDLVQRIVASEKVKYSLGYDTDYYKKNYMYVF